MSRPSEYCLHSGAWMSTRLLDMEGMAYRHLPKHHQQRQELFGNARTWEDLDTPIWRKEEGEEEEWDAVEAYFAYLYRPLAGR
ncbi:hypothetical protein EV426DRAFT_707262 [Tirmania nivea]|nr:hypothetical protein EV426DRAFT_707262 [Tirmania nivea]